MSLLALWDTAESALITAWLPRKCFSLGPRDKLRQVTLRNYNHNYADLPHKLYFPVLQMCMLTIYFLKMDFYDDYYSGVSMCLVCLTKLGFCDFY